MSFARGFQASYDVVSRAMKDREERRMRDALAEESARFGVTEGAYGEGLQTNIQQVEQLRDQALRDAAARQGTVQDLEGIRAQYQPSIDELQRRAGLTAPDFTVASRGPTFATREEAQTAARPMRTAGLANVYRQFGDVERADELESRAQQQELTGLQISDARTRARQNQAIEKVNTQTSEWLNKRLTDKDGTVRAPTAEDTVASIQHRAALFQQAGLGDQAAAALQQHASIAANQIQLQTAERVQALSTAALGVASGNFDAARQFYDQFVPDGAKITSITEDRRTGAVTINRAALDGTKLPSTTLRGGRDELIAGMNMLRDPMSLYNYSQRQFENDIRTQTLGLQQTREAREAAAGNLITVENRDGTMRVIDTSRLPRDADGQPILPEGTRRAGAKEASPMTAREKQAFDVLKNTERFKRAVETGDENTIRELLTASNIRPETYLGATATPPGGGSWTPATAATTPAAATTQPGLTRDTPPAPQARPMSLLEAFGVNNPESALARTVAPKVEAVQIAGDELKAAQARVAAVGRSGDQRAMAAALADLRQQQQNLDRLLANEQNAPRIRRALGL